MSLKVEHKPMSEVEWQASARTALKMNGWRSYFARPGRRSEPSPHVAGFPDIIATRATRCIAVEMKGPGGVVRQSQTEWLDAFAATGVEAYLMVFPADWHRFLTVVAPDPVQTQMSLTSNSTSVDWLPITPVRST
jgi:hypothetical protein